MRSVADVTSPAVGSVSPTAAENSVLFPEPFGPSTAMDAAARHLDVDRLERDDVAVADGQVLRRQDRAHGASAPAIRSAS